MAVGSISGSSNNGYASAGGGASRGNSSQSAPDAAKQPQQSSTTDPSAGGTQQLSSDEKQQVAKLQQRDREVKAHEAAHVAAGGGFVRGGPTYSYQSGPDGKRYAVGGEVGIDTSPVRNNPEATIAKMQTVRSAALAPADPSGQDRAVASAASAQEAAARKQLNEEEAPAKNGESEKSGEGSAKAATLRRVYNDRGGRDGSPRTPPPQIDITV